MIFKGYKKCSNTNNITRTYREGFSKNFSQRYENVSNINKVIGMFYKHYKHLCNL